MSRVISFDLGSKSLGVAISDFSRTIALGLENFCFNKNAYSKAVKRAIEIIKAKNVNEIVIGLALNMDGSNSESAEKSLKFKEKLLEYDSTLKISMIDERLTTLLVKHLMFDLKINKIKQKKIDMNSAILILDTYLKQQKNNEIKN